MSLPNSFDSYFSDADFGYAEDVIRFLANEIDTDNQPLVVALALRLGGQFTPEEMKALLPEIAEAKYERSVDPSEAEYIVEYVLKDDALEWTAWFVPSSEYEPSPREVSELSESGRSPRSVMRRDVAAWLRRRVQGSTTGVPVLSGLEWMCLHGGRTKNGALKGETDTDYIVWTCPSCSLLLRGGAGIRLMGTAYPLGDEETSHRNALLFEIDCVHCGFIDHFKIRVDQHKRYHAEDCQ